MPSPKTAAKMQEILDFGRTGRDIIPMFFQPHPFGGASNTVSAAIRALLKAGKIERAGLDGTGKPLYRVTMPAATHAAPARAQ